MAIDLEIKRSLIAAMTAKAGESLVLDQCAICDYKTSFFADSRRLFYDAGCFCSNLGYKACDWSELDWVLEPGNGHLPAVMEFIRSKCG